MKNTWATDIRYWLWSIWKNNVNGLLMWITVVWICGVLVYFTFMSSIANRLYGSIGGRFFSCLVLCQFAQWPFNDLNRSFDVPIYCVGRVLGIICTIIFTVHCEFLSLFARVNCVLTLNHRKCTQTHTHTSNGNKRNEMKTTRSDTSNKMK